MGARGRGGRAPERMAAAKAVPGGAGALGNGGSTSCMSGVLNTCGSPGAGAGALLLLTVVRPVAALPVSPSCERERKSGTLTLIVPTGSGAKLALILRLRQSTKVGMLDPSALAPP